MGFRLCLLAGTVLTFACCLGWAVAAEAPVEIPVCGPETPLEVLCKAQLGELHPTQFTVGMVDVKQKIHELDGLTLEERQEYLSTHHGIAVIGPKGKIYLIDRHHTSRAAWETAKGKGPEFQTTYLVIRENLSALSPKKFWETMRAKNWVWLEDGKGKTQPPRLLHHLKIQDLPDDRYRSLAWAVRRLGGFNKSTKPFAEFYWGKRFRKAGIDPGKTPASFEKAVREAYRLARTAAFSALPGYKGKTAKTMTGKTVSRLQSMKCNGLFKGIQ